VNAPRYTRGYAAQVDYFRARGAPPARVFEYYLDAILFKSALPPLSGVMRRDLAFYRSAGTHTIQALMTGDFPWTSAQPNAWIFARLAWNVDADPGSLTADFCAAAFGSEAAPAMASYFARLEKPSRWRSHQSRHETAEEPVPHARAFDIPPTDWRSFYEPSSEIARNAGGRKGDLFPGNGGREALGRG
jgi:hypothetical protein